MDYTPTPDNTTTDDVTNTPNTQMVNNQTPDHVTNFIDQANNTQKKFGHNKFQLQIDELQQEIEKWKLADREKDMKVNLFRKTIATLQSQLQEKSNTITTLEQSLAEQSHSDSITQLQHNHQSILEENTLLKSQLSQTQLELDNQSHANLLLQQQVEQSEQTITQSMAENEVLKSKLDQHHKELVAAREHITSLTDQLKMNTNLFDSTTNELQIVKQELAKLRSANEELASQHQTVTQQLQETEQQLHKQLEAGATVSENNADNNTDNNPNTVRGNTVSRRLARRERRHVGVRQG